MLLVFEVWVLMYIYLLAHCPSHHALTKFPNLCLPLSGSCATLRREYSNFSPGKYSNQDIWVINKGGNSRDKVTLDTYQYEGIEVPHDELCLLGKHWRATSVGAHFQCSP